MIFRAIIHIEDQRRNVGTSRPDGLPPLREAVPQAVTGHFGSHPLYKQFIERRKEEAHGGERGRWLKIVIGRRD